MNTKTSRAFHIDGVTYYFDFLAFKRSFRTYNLQNNPKGTTLTQCEEILAGKLKVGQGTVHGWLCEKNGPIDLNAVKGLATELGLESHMELLYTKERLEDDIPMKITVTDRQLDSLKKIYDAFIIFLDEYSQTNGFNDYYPDFTDIEDANERRDAEIEFYKELHNKMYKVALVYQQESIVLHQLDIEDLEDLIYEDLPPLYVDQLDPEERKDARIREDRTWREVSWEVAREYILDRLNEFMYQYF